MKIQHAKSVLCDSKEYIFEFITTKNQYLKSYPVLIKATEILCRDMGSDAIPAIAHLVYGWMPTILKSYDFEGKSNALIFQALDIQDVLEAHAFIQKFTSSPVNNSMVGLSKVLHFINPEFFPIWDRRVAKHFGIHSHSQIQRIENYLQYMKFVEAHAEHLVVRQVQKTFLEKTKVHISTTRACEFILFMS